jgi:hypothetical protein
MAARTCSRLSYRASTVGVASWALARLLAIAGCVAIVDLLSLIVSLIVSSIVWVFAPSGSGRGKAGRRVRIGPLPTARFVVAAHVLLLDDHDAVIGLERDGRVQGRFGIVVDLVGRDFVRALLADAIVGWHRGPRFPARALVTRSVPAIPRGESHCLERPTTRPLGRSDARFVVIAPG